MQLEDMKKLASLARLEISDEELVEIGNSFDGILAYVGQVQEVSELSNVEPVYPLHNVMRDDVVTNEAGEWREKILAQMPNTQDGYLKVKQIL
jgi:aspartyl-tRNA(Asn)/glutamyl-tRNA(Gln) amidotransferase subunit C